METHYNDALEKAKQAIIDCGSNAGRKEMIYGIFPELREWGEAEAASATDEKIRKELSAFLWNVANGSVKSMPSASMCQKWAVYLNKQKAKEQYDRLAPIYAEQESFESALDKAWKFYNDSGSSTVDGCEDNAVELAFAKGFREGFLYKESQKEQNPAKWSEKDEEMIARICANLEYIAKEAGSDSEFKEKLEERIKWMKRLKPLCPQPGLSKEDFIKFGNREYERGRQDGIQFAERFRWKPGEDGIQQPHWKPREDHFQGLRRGIMKVEKGSDAWNSLTDLYEQLEKL